MEYAGASTYQSLDNKIQVIALFDALNEYCSAEELKIVEDSLSAINRHSDSAKSAETYGRSLQLAIILASKTRTNSWAIALALLFEPYRRGSIGSPELIAMLGLKALNVIDTILTLDTYESVLIRPRAAGYKSSPNQNKLVQKMLIETTLNADPLQIFLADRCVLLSEIIERKHDPYAAVELARISQDIYAPLAGRLGMTNIEGELEDKSFQILDPKSYKYSRDLIDAVVYEKREYIDEVCRIIYRALRDIGLNAEVKGRVKNASSLQRKIIRKISVSGETDFTLIKDQYKYRIFDVLGFRILVDSYEECYLALDQLHKLWPPKQGRYKDYIVKPKANGYQSLHTTVESLGSKNVEIQIRTHEMDQNAEYGTALHWLYKNKGGSNSISTASRGHELDLSGNGLSGTSADSAKMIVPNHTFVFTPKGDVRMLPIGAKPLDFAFSIHSSIGCNYAGSLIQAASDEYTKKRMVPIDYSLQNGDIVEILTNRNARPSGRWLAIAKSASTRSKIRHYLRSSSGETSTKVMSGTAAASKITGRPRLRSETEETAVINNRFTEIGGMLTSLANCCKPTTSDKTVGFISQGRGMIIHKSSCPNIKRLKPGSLTRVIELTAFIG